MPNKKVSIIKKYFLIIAFVGVALVFSACDLFVSEELISTSVSPNETYQLQAYLVNGGATTSYTVKVYRVNDNPLFNKKLIYSKYREVEAEIKWIDDKNVEINGVVLNLEKDEVFIENEYSFFMTNFIFCEGGFNYAQ